MTLQILLLKKDNNQVTGGNDLHPPPEDLLGRFHVTGSYDAVVLAVVPDGFSFAQRNRIPVDDTIFVVKEALEIPDPPPPDENGVLRW